MNKLRSCREQMGYSQKQVALEIGVAAPTVSQWEAGIKTPSRENFRKLADLYGVSVDFLLDRSEDRQSMPTDIMAQNEKSLLRLFRSLNDQGQRRLLEYAQDMVQLDRWTKGRTEAAV